MFGLSPGRYRVSAGRGDYVYGGSTSFSGRVSYKEVFYPAATDGTKGEVIEVNEGSEATNIDIALGRPFEMFSASGRIVDGEKPVTNVRLTVQRIVGDQMEFTPQFLMSNSLGEFTAEGLIPGKYNVFLMPDMNAELRAEPTTFEIIDGDVSGITVRV